ncbi:MAG: phosphatidate cytidylyltransferase [Flammeovirgaceae bacterium]|jgi:phosphatidate cytidylyltransferase
MRSTLDSLPELTQRIIAAIFGGALLISSIIYSEWSYFVIFFLICMFASLEFYKLLGLDGNLPLKSYGTVNSLFIYTLTFLIARQSLETKYYLLIFISLSAVYLIKLYIKKDKTPFTNIAFTFLGIIYVGIPFALLNLAIFYDNSYNYEIILGSLFMLWASDTGAYFAGKNFGRRKLFERVSPKKTWEGSLGGTIAAVSVGIVLSYYFTSMPVWKWIAISLIIVVAGTYGDLVESLFKRSIRIKDSGRSIPGHGGFLDRFDGLLIAAPFIVAFVRLF